MPSVICKALAVLLGKAKVEALAAVTFKAPEEFKVTTPEPEPMLEVPVEDSVVKAPVPAVVAPIETKFAAPEVLMFQLSSVMETPVAEALPIVMVLATAPLPL